MFKRVVDFLNEYLRINAIRRMLSVVEVKRLEIVGLVTLAVLFAVFEGIGLSLLLPILQFAEGGATAITSGSGIIWSTISRIMSFLHLPVTLPVLLLMAFVPILLRQGVFYASAWYSAVVAGRIGVRMRMMAVDALMEADPEFFTRHTLGKIVGVVIGQTATAGNALLQVIRQISIALLMLLYVAILVAISLPLTALTVLFAALLSVVVRVNIIKIRDFGIEAARVSQEMSGKVVERFSLIRLIKLRDQAGVESDRIRGFSEIMRAIQVKQARLSANVEITADPLLMLSAFLALYVGITHLHMTLAQLGLVMFLLTRLNAKVKEFNSGRQVISANMAGLLLVKEMTEDARRSNTIRRGELAFSGLEDEIRLEEVSFEYPAMRAEDGSAADAGKRVLKGVSLNIPAGSFIALVGRSGGGKSTLVELLPRLREATEGRITFDGVDITRFDVGTLRKGIGYLTQSAMLFNDTVRQNLTYGLDFEPTEDQIRTALEAAYATFVYELPQGLETRLGDQGVRFSGGERQRIALARVLLEDTSILILDEPTSALDSESESYIQDALARLHGRKTIIVIAHRLATVSQADQLLVIDDGQIVDRGTHGELYERSDAYRRLFEGQASGTDG
ncbi:MAG: ABC transporter ATP-binding protein [Coriobacteriia bacterium]|nr:ABC transporter ATP-binding protein [Coriobacteriia bacterium]